MSYIKVEQVSKHFRTFKNKKGFFNSLKSLFKREYEIIKAVDNISFEVAKGELVGYIGPNGAGKSTTIKMLSGILLPTSGKIEVNGRIPHQNRKENALNMGIVFGQRSQLYWDLPMEETFDLYKKMYHIPDDRFQHNVAFYSDLLEMHSFLRKPVRQLSLGQKMRAELTIALLHDPDIVYLDEPTIGLDVVAKNKIRHFIREINEQNETTVILTTHDMDDIEQICDRIIMIDKGVILYDGSIDFFKEKYGEESMLIVEFKNEDVNISDPRLEVIKEEGTIKWIIFKNKEIATAEAITQLTRKYDILDLKYEEPEIEEIVRNIYENPGQKRKNAAGVPGIE